jgi:hypothetical protein
LYFISLSKKNIPNEVTHKVFEKLKKNVFLVVGNKSKLFISNIWQAAAK